MALSFELTEKEGKKFELTPIGSYIATLFKVVDKGTHPKIFKGVENGKARQFQFTFELTDPSNPWLTNADGNKFTVSSTVNFALGARATLSKIIKSILGLKEYQERLDSGKITTLNELVGKSVVLAVKHRVNNEVTYANIDNQSFAEIQPGVTVPELVAKPLVFSLEEDEFNPEIFDGLHEKMQDFIKLSPEYKACTGGSKGQLGGF